ncbi:fumarylacetoacetase [Blastococcus litoris]|uniref:fumarylacetoacetase n=1 Tax=Blastococcus litoris TaxID=2171622 RepID=UPI000E30879A|nr:fumarylacetoacetase [Blastococcus litoris]
MTWVELPDGTGFGIDNLPLGVVLGGGRPGIRHAVRIGDSVLDLHGVTGLPVHATRTLDSFLVAGPDAWRDLREQVTEWLTDERHRARVEPHLLPLAAVQALRPIGVADYVDFYSSRAHAENVGRLFRPDGDPLPPNWLHLPIGYHGRAGTVQVSGAPVVRPCGQIGPPGDDGLPPFGPTRRLDLEAELGFVVGAPSEPGERVPVEAFGEHVFGVCLVNDWSARDLQAWEYQPLGPFLGKSFATSMSPWIVPLAALEAARVPPPPRDAALLPYLRDDAAPWGLDVELEVRINGEVVSRPPFRDMYWTAAQQLAHLTVNGAPVLAGELFASGTVSGAAREQWGSLLELTANGTRPLPLADGSTRAFLEDGDTVCITASAPGPHGARIGFGEVTGRVLPAR